MARQINPFYGMYNVVQPSAPTTTSNSVVRFGTQEESVSNHKFGVQINEPTTPTHFVRFEEQSNTVATGIWTLVAVVLFVSLAQAVRVLGRFIRRRLQSTERLVDIEEPTISPDIDMDTSTPPPARIVTHPVVLSDFTSPHMPSSSSLIELDDLDRMRLGLRRVRSVNILDNEYETMLPVPPSMPVLAPTHRTQFLDEILGYKYNQRRS